MCVHSAVCSVQCELCRVNCKGNTAAVCGEVCSAVCSIVYSEVCSAVSSIVYSEVCSVYCSAVCSWAVFCSVRMYHHAAQCVLQCTAQQSCVSQRWLSSNWPSVTPCPTLSPPFTAKNDHPDDHHDEEEEEEKKKKNRVHWEEVIKVITAMNNAGWESFLSPNHIWHSSNYNGGGKYREEALFWCKGDESKNENKISKRTLWSWEYGWLIAGMKIRGQGGTYLHN